MKKMKKIALGTLAALSTVAVPVVAVVSCGDKDEAKTPTFAIDEKGGHEKLEAWRKKHMDEKTQKIDADVNIKFGDKIAHIKKSDTPKEIAAKMNSILPK